MVFTEEDRVVVQFLRQNKGYSARHFGERIAVEKLENWRFSTRNLGRKLVTMNRLLGWPAAVGKEPSELMITSNVLETMASVYSFNVIITPKFLTHVKIT